MIRKIRFSVILPALLIPLLFAGCSRESGQSGKGEKDVANVTQATKEQIVKQRAQQRWDARIARDWERAYALMAPGIRSTRPLEVFINQMKSAALVYSKAEVEKVECPDDDACKVVTWVTYVYMGTQDALRGEEGDSRVEERWILIDGDWWFAK